MMEWILNDLEVVALSLINLLTMPCNAGKTKRRKGHNQG